MSTIGRTMTVRGEVRCAEDLTIEGCIEGPVFCEGGCVVLAASSDVRGDIIARDITVHGRHAGQLIATDIVDIRADGTVKAQVIARRFILDPAARFEGRVEPQHLEAALHVAKFQQRKRDAVRPA
jgi:cytoskeletal protein CcmA (bactofilin family)